MKIIRVRSTGAYWRTFGNGVVFGVENAHRFTDQEAEKYVGNNINLEVIDVTHVPKYEDQTGRVTPLQLRGYTSTERKAMPVQTLLAEYFPDAIFAVARHALKANVKHNGPDAPMQWARKKSTDHLNCAARHLTTPDAIDADTGEIELVGAAWRCLAALQLREEKRLVSEGIKPLSGVVDVEELQEAATPRKA